MLSETQSQRVLSDWQVSHDSEELCHENFVKIILSSVKVILVWITILLSWIKNHFVMDQKNFVRNENNFVMADVDHRKTHTFLC